MRNLAIGSALLLAPLSASATVLNLNGGWQDDQVNEAGQPSQNSAWTFTIATGAHLSLTDCCNTGDVYTLSGDIAGLSALGAGANDVRATGSYGSYWLNPLLGKYTAFLGAGTYNFSVTGDGAGGIPAGFGLRLDSGVPEPASWAMLLAGFGLVGAVSRRRAVTVAA